MFEVLFELKLHLINRLLLLGVFQVDFLDFIIFLGIPDFLGKGLNAGCQFFLLIRQYRFLV